MQIVGTRRIEEIDARRIFAGVFDTVSEFVYVTFAAKFECLGVIQDKSTGVDVYLGSSILMTQIPPFRFQVGDLSCPFFLKAIAKSM